MENNDYRNGGYEQNESKSKNFWRNVFIGVLAVFVAVLTVVVINL